MSSNRKFFRSAKRGDAASEVNARYGHDPGLGFYTHVCDQHGPCSVQVMSAISHMTGVPGSFTPSVASMTTDAVPFLYAGGWGAGSAAIDPP